MGTSVSSRFHLSSEAKRPFGKELTRELDEPAGCFFLFCIECLQSVAVRCFFHMQLFR